MNPKPKKQPRRPKREDGSFSKGTVALIWIRDDGKCAWCGTNIVGNRGPAPWDWQAHHRWPRAIGGTSAPHVARASNGVLLHGSCHTLIESQRTEAIDKGFIVVHGIQLPSEVEIEHAVHGLVRLDDHGGYEAVAA